MIAAKPSGYPLYAYVRRRVADVNEAQDLTQEFFVRLLEKKYLAIADPCVASDKTGKSRPVG